MADLTQSPLLGGDYANANPLAQQPTFTASDAVGRLIDAWQRGSDNHAQQLQQLGMNPLSLSGLGENWQKLPGMSTAQGFAPADMGVVGSIASAPTRGVFSQSALEQLAEKSPFADRKITKLAEKAEEAHDSFKMHMDDPPPHEDDAATEFIYDKELEPETDEEAMKLWRESPEYTEYQNSVQEHAQEANKLAQDYKNAIAKYSSALQDHMAWLGGLTDPLDEVFKKLHEQQK